MAAEKATVSEVCREEAAQELRDPKSAEFGEEEYVFAVDADDYGAFDVYGGAPVAERTYRLVGEVNGRNGFGGMGNGYAYECHVSFDEAGAVISKRSSADLWKTDTLAEVLKRAKTDSIETDGAGTP